MIAYPTRTVSVTATPINIRKTPAFANDPAAYPVTYSVLRYAAGGETIQILSGSPFATGTLTFVTNPVDTETIAVNGVTFTFVAGASGATDVHIGSTKEDTALELVNVLNASASGSITPATYSVAYGGNIVTITYDTAGTTGNSFTLANSSGTVAVTRSASTLLGGQAYGNGQLIDAAADFNDVDQSLVRYVVASGAGPTTLYVTDMRA